MTPTLRLVFAGLIAGAFQAPAAPVSPTNSAPNPYETVENYFKLSDGRVWGSTSAVDVDKDGKSIWVAERCGVRTTTDASGQPVTRATNSCWDAANAKFLPLDPIMKRWWAHMADIMETNPDNSPVDRKLLRVFHME